MPDTRQGFIYITKKREAFPLLFMMGNDAQMPAADTALFYWLDGKCKTGYDKDV
jgi:hypothetical protein